MRSKVEHGGDIYRNYNNRRIHLDFSVNVNPLGMPEEARAAAAAALEECVRYPDIRAGETVRAIALHENVPAEWILVGNGAAELLYAAAHAVGKLSRMAVTQGDGKLSRMAVTQEDEKLSRIDGKQRESLHGLVQDPTFEEYGAALKAAGLREKRFACLGELTEEKCAELLHEIGEDTGIVFWCNPNNPTGILTEKKLLVSVADRCRETGTVLCIDECFLSFVREEADYTMKDLLAEYPNLMILRAFTKFYGMPGLRLGYLMTSGEKLRKEIRMQMQPWNTSIIAQAAGVAALNAEKYAEETVTLIERERTWLAEQIRAGLSPEIYVGAANYIFFRAEEGLKEKLAERGILIRTYSRSDSEVLKESLQKYEHEEQQAFYRIAVRTHEENEELIRCWKEVLSNA